MSACIYYKCLSNFLIQNVLNPKCPSCNYNLLQDYDKKNIEEVYKIEVTKKINENIETQNIQENIENLNTNENILYSRNINNINRSRISNMNDNNIHNNNVENGGNTNEIEEKVNENI